MMLIISYIRLAESFCSVNYIQLYMFQILEENLHDYGSFYKVSVISSGFRWCQLFPGFSEVVVDVFKSFQVVSCFIKYIEVLIKNSV